MCNFDFMFMKCSSCCDRKRLEVQGDTQLFAEGTLGKTPEGYLTFIVTLDNSHRKVLVALPAGQFNLLQINSQQWAGSVKPWFSRPTALHWIHYCKVGFMCCYTRSSFGVSRYIHTMWWNCNTHRNCLKLASLTTIRQFNRSAKDTPVDGCSQPSPLRFCGKTLAFPYKTCLLTGFSICYNDLS